MSKICHWLLIVTLFAQAISQTSVAAHLSLAEQATRQISLAIATRQISLAIATRQISLAIATRQISLAIATRQVSLAIATRQISLAIATRQISLAIATRQISLAEQATRQISLAIATRQISLAIATRQVNVPEVANTSVRVGSGIASARDKMPPCHMATQNQASVAHNAIAGQVKKPPCPCCDDDCQISRCGAACLLLLRAFELVIIERSDAVAQLGDVHILRRSAAPPTPPPNLA